MRLSSYTEGQQKTSYAEAPERRGCLDTASGVVTAPRIELEGGLDRGDVVALGKRVALVWRVEDDVVALLPILPWGPRPGPQDLRLGSTGHAVRCRPFAWPLRAQPVVGNVSEEVMARVGVALRICEAAQAVAACTAEQPCSRPDDAPGMPPRQFRVRRHPHHYVPRPSLVRPHSAGPRV